MPDEPVHLPERLRPRQTFWPQQGILARPVSSRARM